MTKNKKAIQEQRKTRVRKFLLDRSDLPRLIIKRSNQHLHAQVIDSTGKVLAAASSTSLPTPEATKTASAKAVGVKLAEAITKAKVKAVVLDRGHYRFHGRIKAFVESLKDQGIKI